ncbi:hypothetical protein ACN93_20715 [Gordonia paraffinivorans]|nr:hypothetical protein ACN93_20715 [Gordonia paraffinivorans]
MPVDTACRPLGRIRPASCRRTCTRAVHEESCRVRKSRIRHVLAGVITVLTLTVVSLFGSSALGSPAAHADTPLVHQVDYTCGDGYYRNSEGACTRGPDGSATGIRCKDGTYSHAKNRQGACSRHGGIADGSGGDGSGSSDTGSAAMGFGSAVIGGAVVGSLLLGMLAFGS